MNNEAQVFDTPSSIKYFQLAAARGAIRLERLGMRHSRGRSVKAMWARHLGMKRGATHAAVIAELERLMATAKALAEG
jgi:hypothetical protein